MTEREKQLEPEASEKAPIGGSDEEKDELHERCNLHRDEMAPHETATCAGEELAEEFQAEEDGGS